MFFGSCQILKTHKKHTMRDVVLKCLTMILALCVTSMTLKPCLDRLPNSCKSRLTPVWRYGDNKYTMRFVCRHLAHGFSFSNSTLQTLRMCSIKIEGVYFNLKANSIVDQKFKASELQSFRNRIASGSIHEYLKVIMNNVQGFEIDAFRQTSFRSLTISFKFYHSSLVFFSNGSRLKKCSEYPRHPSSFFQLLRPTGPPSASYLEFYYPKSYSRICPLAFRNLNVPILVVHQLIETFYKKNILTFLDDLPDDVTDINATLNDVTFSACEKITVNKRIINPLVFNRTRSLKFIGEIRAIESGTFKSLAYLNTITFEAAYWRKMIQHGADWIRDLCPEVKGNLMSSSSVNRARKTISINYEYINLETNQFNDVFPDEDFCIYREFSFNQTVSLSFLNIKITESRLTCTIVWLFRSFSINTVSGQYNPSEINQILKVLAKRCQFEKR